MNLEGLSLIGAGRGTPGGVCFTGINPVNGEALPGKFYTASFADLESATKHAAAAFGGFGGWSGRRRAALLCGIAERLEAGAAPIIERAHLETVLPLARLEGEMGRTCFQLRLLAQAAESGLFVGARIDHAQPDRKPLPKPDLRSLLRPLGPVAVFGASNFPLAFSVAGGDTAAALAAGCPVIVKAHPAHPGTSELVGRIIQQTVAELGAPEGTFSLLFDAGHEIGAALVAHPAIKAVGFTGSRNGGRALMDIAAARPEPIPVYAEMSSINPVFLLAGALAGQAESIATGLQASVGLGVGQFCTNPGLVFIEAGEGAAPFLAKLENLMAAAPAGTMLTPGICAAYRAGVEALSQVAGVQCLVAPGSAPDRGAQAGAALFLTDAGTFLRESALMHEVFGPATIVVRCASREQMLRAAEHLEGQLTATIHSSPEELAENRALVDLLAIKAGRLLFGGFPTGVEVTHAMTHGGPFPATSDGRSTSVGTRAIERFLRPVSYQSFPDDALPPELQEANPLGIPRLVDGNWIAA